MRTETFIRMVSIIALDMKNIQILDKQQQYTLTDIAEHWIDLINYLKIYKVKTDKPIRRNGQFYDHNKKFQYILVNNRQKINKYEI